MNFNVIKKEIDEKIKQEKSFDTIEINKSDKEIASEIRARKKTIRHLKNIKKGFMPKNN